MRENEELKNRVYVCVCARATERERSRIEIRHFHCCYRPFFFFFFFIVSQVYLNKTNVRANQAKE